MPAPWWRMRWTFRPERFSRPDFFSDPGEVTAWVKALPDPSATIYEAGSNGYGLTRSLLSHDIWTVVAAPSKLQRPSGSRVKTDALDAEHLSTLLRLDVFTAVAVPDELTQVAHDAWLKRQRFDSPLVQAAFDESYDSVITIMARCDRLDERIEATAVNIKSIHRCCAPARLPV